MPFYAIHVNKINREALFLDTAYIFEYKMMNRLGIHHSFIFNSLWLNNYLYFWYLTIEILIKTRSKIIVFPFSPFYDIRHIDSDLEYSTSDYQASDSEDVLSLSNESLSNNTMYDSDVSVDHINNFDENWRFLCVADVEADPVCRRLDKLIRDGEISKENILYKYLDNVTKIFYNAKHPYSKDVVEFFTTIAHLGGESTYNFVRGPMGYGNKHAPSNEIRINLGGPGIETLRYFFIL